MLSIAVMCYSLFPFLLIETVVRFNNVTSPIVNANLSFVRADEKLTAFVELESVIRPRCC